MAAAGFSRIPPPDRGLRNAAAIVGVGETDYGDDYRAARTKPPGYEAPSPEKLAVTAFERALADSGLARGDIDGLTVSFLYGGPDPAATAGLLGLTPRYLETAGGLFAGPLPTVCAAIAAGQADTVAMVYAVASRAIGRQYGGKTYEAGDRTPPSYYYYHPWGFSSQAAHWALIARRYHALYGTAETDLGHVAVQLRRNAIARPGAVMQQPMTLADYAASRAIVTPLRLFDMCLVNDGAVCLIVTRADRARDSARTPVLVSGWGESIAKGDKFDILVRQRLRTQLQDASAQAFAMAGVARGDVRHFEGYDPASIHLVNQLEGYDFVAEGEGLDFFARGDAVVGGELPVNTGGGMMSGAYMHGWNLAAEAVHQLRHDAGARQIGSVRVSMLSVAQTDEVHPIILTRGN